MLYLYPVPPTYSPKFAFFFVPCYSLSLCFVFLPNPTSLFHVHPPSSVFLSSTCSFPHIPHYLSSSSCPSRLQPTSLLPLLRPIYLLITLTHHIFKLPFVHSMSYFFRRRIILIFSAISLMSAHNSYIFCNSFNFSFIFFSIRLKVIDLSRLPPYAPCPFLTLLPFAVLAPLSRPLHHH